MIRVIKKVLSITLVVALVMTSSTMIFAAKTKEKKVTTKQDALESIFTDAADGNKKNNRKKAEKDEIVFTELKSDGAVSEVSVSDTLLIKGKDPIKDKSILKDIENISGDEKFQQTNDGKIVWENKGKDISYMGTTTMIPPLEVEVHYYLDGIEYKAEEMVGKSGEVQITYDFKNKAKTKKYDYIPFIFLGGFTFSDEHFANVEIDNGNVIDYGESRICIGYAVPGLQDQLVKPVKGFNKFFHGMDFASGFTISADVVDFQMDMGVIAAFSSLGDIDFSKLIDTKELKRTMLKLQGGVDALVDGIGKVGTGVGQLQDGAVDVTDGIGNFYIASKKLYSASGSLKGALNKFVEGLLGNLKKSVNGAVTLADGTEDLANGIGDIDAGMDKTVEGVVKLDVGAEGLYYGIDQLLDGFYEEDGLIDGAKALKNGASDARDGVNELIDNMEATPTSIQVQIDEIIAQVKEASGGMISSAATLKFVVEGINAQVKKGSSLEDVLKKSGLSVSDYYQLLEANYSVQILIKVKESLEKELEDSSEEIEALKEGMKALKSGSKDLYEGILYAGEVIGELDDGAKTLVEGTGDLVDGTKNMADGTEKLKDGSKTISKGMNTFAEGEEIFYSKLSAGSPKLMTGATKIRSALYSATKGVLKLYVGFQDFCEGLDSLANGIGDVHSGATKLNDEGLKKLTSGMTKKNKKSALDSISKLFNAGKSYNTFTGKDKNMKGNVKFIFRLPEVGVEELGEE